MEILRNGTQRVRWYWFLMLLLAACQQTPPSDSPTPTLTDPAQSIFQVESTGTAVPTPTAVPTKTAVPTPIPTKMVASTAVPTETATPTPISTQTVTPTAIPTEETHFQLTATLPDPIQRLWLAPDGRPWAVTANALYAYRDGEWQVEQQGSAIILGQDSEGRAWVMLDTALAVYTAEEWQRYGPAWDAAALTNPEDGVTGLAVDRQGRVWVAHGRNGLHRFDPAAQQWQTLRAADLGYPPPPDEDIEFAAYDPHLFFTGAALDSFGDVWVSACPLLVWEDGPISHELRDGNGVRWFDGHSWGGPDITANRCVWGVSADGLGRVWIAGPKNDLWSGEDDFIRYVPEGGWERPSIPHDEALYGDRPHFVSRVWLDGDVAWLFVEYRGGASFPAPAVYVGQDGRWQTVADELGGTIAFGGNGEAWVWVTDIAMVGDKTLFGLQHFQNGMWTAVPTPPDLFDFDMLLLVDGNGRLWITGSDNVSIWHYDP